MQILKQKGGKKEVNHVAHLPSIWYMQVKHSLVIGIRYITATWSSTAKETWFNLDCIT